MARAKKSKYEYVIGQIFGYVEPVEYIGKSRFRCICHRCGNETTTDIGSLLNGKKKSCGCLPPFKDMTGQDFGDLHVDKYVETRHHSAFWQCTCKRCGKVKVYEGKRLRSGKASCGCLTQPKRYMDIAGKQFGDIFVESFAYTKQGSTYWNCICGCGKKFVASGKRVSSGNTKSCGCLKHRYGKDNPNFIDRVGTIYNGGLKAIRHIHGKLWEFECLHCGNHKVIESSGVVTGAVRSCGCLNSSSAGSQVENEIKSFIESCGVATMKSHRLLDGREIDIYIPELNLGIEYNGSAFHATIGGAFSNKDKNYHKNKFILAREKGIHLISIFDYAWKSNQEKIKNYLHDVIASTARIYARKCELCIVSKSEAVTFTDKYHLQGSARLQEINYGLYYENELISVMSFGKPRYKEKSNTYELQRYCVKTGITVVGGAERLLKAFEQEYSPLKVISYSDSNYFSGGIYPRLGFTFVKYTEPDYVWVHNGDLSFLSRYKCQVKTLKNKYPELYEQAIGSKENYIMSNLGYFKIYGCGNILWEKTYERN